LAEGALDEVRQLRANDPWGYVTRFQVISPQRKGVLGVDELNDRLQQVFNPDGECVKRADGRVYRVGDRVVHMKNKDMKILTKHQVVKFREGASLEMDDARIMNGQLGLVYAVNEDNEMVVFYPFEKRLVHYGRKDLGGETIDLAYALTIHKSQGSEYKQVVMPLTMSHFSMLTTPMVYTGMTRAKDRLDMVGQLEALRSACNPRRMEDAQRDTIISALMHAAKAQVRPRPGM
jgi:exodeoxyribonuclease V alpha subunit